MASRVVQAPAPKVESFVCLHSAAFAQHTGSGVYYGWGNRHPLVEGTVPVPETSGGVNTESAPQQSEDANTQADCGER